MHYEIDSYEDKDGFIKVFDVKSVYILKELYYNDVLNYWHYPEAIRTVIDEMESRGIVTFESTLLSRNEQDYLDFYLIVCQPKCDTSSMKAS